VVIEKLLKFLVREIDTQLVKTIRLGSGYTKEHRNIQTSSDERTNKQTNKQTNVK
jgi:hypothetical protein